MDEKPRETRGRKVGLPEWTAPGMMRVIRVELSIRKNKLEQCLYRTTKMKD